VITKKNTQRASRFLERKTRNCWGKEVKGTGAKKKTKASKKGSYDKAAKCSHQRKKGGEVGWWVKRITRPNIEKKAERII